MASSQKLTKYYALFGLLLAFTLGAVIYTVSQGSGAKTDKTTSDKITEISTKLEDFIVKNNQLPATLDDAGVNNIPSSIKYTKIGEREYKLCATYKSAGGGFNAGWLSLLTGALASHGSTSSSSSASSDYLDTYSLAFAYKKGQNCQTVKPPGLGGSPSTSSGTGTSVSPSPSGSSSSSLLSPKCGAAGATFELKDETTLKSVDSGQGLLTLETANAKLTDKNSSPVKSLATINYDSLTAIYSISGCKKLAVKDVDALKPGAAVTVYLYAHDSTYADQLEL